MIKDVKRDGEELGQRLLGIDLQVEMQKGPGAGLRAGRNPAGSRQHISIYSQAVENTCANLNFLLTHGF